MPGRDQYSLFPFHHNPNNYCELDPKSAKVVGRQFLELNHCVASWRDAGIWLGGGFHVHGQLAQSWSLGLQWDKVVMKASKTLVLKWVEICKSSFQFSHYFLPFFFWRIQQLKVLVFLYVHGTQLSFTLVKWAGWAASAKDAVFKSSETVQWRWTAEDYWWVC